MATLNLTANGKSQELILAYLQENASDVLIDKINSGTPIEKNGKTLINKKTLDGFMSFAGEEALKLIAENERKGKVVRCIEDATVFGWAIHYFEEESIEGKLYNLDGTEYEPPNPVKKATKHTTPAVPYTPPAPKPKPQMSIFDMLDGQSQPEETPAPAIEETDGDDEQPTPEELEEIYAEEQARENEQKKGSPMYQHYLSVKAKYKDCIVFYRLGDFYEMFGQDAITSANELNLTLTGRDCGLDERIPMTGVPFHAADVYISKLVDKGYKVAVVEPLGDGKPNSERVIEPKPVIDAETDDVIANDEEIEKLSEPEMREFDGDMQEPKAADDEQDDPPYSLSSFDKETMIYLYDLLDGKLDIA